MPLPKVIAPKPTKYKGVLYRSRLEASWAVYWDALGYKTQYETWGPHRELVTDGQNLFDYTPDFLIQVNSSYQFFQEVKPVYPNAEYVIFLQRIGAAIAPSGNALLMTVGGFRDPTPPKVLHFPYTATYPLESILWGHKKHKRSVEIAANMRWDLYTDDSGKTRKRKPK